MKNLGVTLSVGKRQMKLSIRQIIKTVWFTSGAIFMIWLMISYQARGFDDAVLESSSTVTVAATKDYLSFSPVNSLFSTALIFYPGGMVSPEAYAPVARNLAGKGFKVIIIKMPFRMASFGYEKAKAFIINDQSTKKWVLGGHSLGAAKAAQFALENPGLLHGLILMGTSHPRDFDLSALQMDITKIYATHDGLATVDKVKANAAKLPAHTHWVEIKGGNHAQFGWYGSQLGDNDAAISRQEQQEILLQALTAALQRISAEK